jgi:folate-dependent phosphoribosylglycinamide formyltransferase PurN
MRGLSLARRRMKKLGLLRVAGQVLFSAIVAPCLKYFSRKRIKEIKKQYSFNEAALPTENKAHFSSVNEDACVQLLKKLNPDIVIVNGTRIISKKVLACTNAKFINMHTGITPKYRGVHGGYWAVVNNDLVNCGVTVHFVDAGIDTGGVLFQALIPVTRVDNYITYPFLQFGEGLQLMKKAVDDVLASKAVIIPPFSLESHLWYHPTIWQYFGTWIFKRKK